MGYSKLSGDQIVFSEQPFERKYIRAENSCLDLTYEQYLKEAYSKLKPKKERKKK